MIISVFLNHKNLEADNIHYLLDRNTRFINDKHFVMYNNKEYLVKGRAKQNLPQDYIVLETSV